MMIRQCVMLRNLIITIICGSNSNVSPGLLRLMYEHHHHHCHLHLHLRSPLLTRSVPNLKFDFLSVDLNSLDHEIDPYSCALTRREHSLQQQRCKKTIISTQIANAVLQTKKENTWVNLLTRQVLPTPAFPTNTTCTSKSLSPIICSGRELDVEYCLPSILHKLYREEEV